MSSAPLDPRLLRRVRAMRGYVAATTLLGVAATAFVVLQAIMLAGIVARVTDGATLEEIRADVGWLAVAVLGRSCAAWGQERLGRRAAVTVIAQMRTAVLCRLDRPGPARRRLAEGGQASVAALLTQGLDALDPYLTRYLPQLLLCATLTPAVLLVILGLDGWSALTILLTLPLIPIFMILIGLVTQGQAQRRLASLQRLGTQLLDLLAGLPTLRAFGREVAQAHRVREVGAAYRRATMATLRTAFLSALVLETLTTLSIALVAVGIGLRLVDGGLDLQTGLTVLLLAPEVYLPLRMVGVHFHASADGLAAADAALTILEEPVDAERVSVRDIAVGDIAVGDIAVGDIRFDQVTVAHPDRGVAAPSGAGGVIRAGTITAIVGESGSGKSTLVRVLLTLQPSDEGAVTVGGMPLCAIPRQSWWQQITWVPQRGTIVPGTVRDNVMLFIDDPDAVPPERLEAAARAAGLDEVLSTLPEGWQTPIGQGGRGVSAGQRQRIALTRALLSPRALVVLDEPTAHLDRTTEQRVLAALVGLRDAGHAVVLVAHRPALRTIADAVVEVRSSPLTTAVGESAAQPEVTAVGGGR